MPAYLIEFETDQGPQRRRFTIDQDRVLEPQVRQILEELNQRGTVLAGGPDQELGVFWNGREVSTGQTPAQLGLAPERSIELRMRPRRREAIRMEIAAPEPAPPRQAPPPPKVERPVRTEEAPPPPDEPPPVDETDEVDIEGDADADGNEAEISGMALIQRELGGQIIREIDNS